MNLQEQIQQLRDISAEYQAKIGPLLEGIKPYIAAAKKAESMGLTAESSADDIIDAFANSVSFNPPEIKAVYSVLKAGAPEEIRQAAEAYLAGWEAMGNAVGKLGGIVLGLAV